MRVEILATMHLGPISRNACYDRAPRSGITTRITASGRLFIDVPVRPQARLRFIRLLSVDCHWFPCVAPTAPPKFRIVMPAIHLIASVASSACSHSRFIFEYRNTTLIAEPLSIWRYVVVDVPSYSLLIAVRADLSSHFNFNESTLKADNVRDN